MGGVIVAGGTVTVFADVDTLSQSSSFALTVNPRSWPGTPITAGAYDNEVDSTYEFWDLDPSPDSAAELGHTHPSITPVENYVITTAIGSVVGGPNDSLYYHLSAPYDSVYYVIEINRDALTNPNNPWYDNHPSNGPPPKNPTDTCRQSELEDELLDHVIAHEARHISFAEVYFSQAANSLNVVAERMVMAAESSTPKDDLYSSTFVRAVTALNAQTAENNQSVHSSYDPDDTPCRPIYSN